MDFLAFDVETANSDMASICQIGIVSYENSIPVKEWSFLVDPEDYFDFWQNEVHKINEEDVIDSPTFLELYSEMKSILQSKTVICHTHFDRVSLNKACQKYDLDIIDINWLDSALVARRTWKEFAWKGYGLANVCKKLNYSLKHHDALEDAKAAGYILIEASRIKGYKSIDKWQQKLNKPINNNESFSIIKEANPEGSLFGEVIVFTGSLRILRREAAELAANVGCKVESGVTKKTTILVVGDLDISRYGNKSSKHKKAEKLLKEGQEIKIIKESDFVDLVNI